MVSRMIFDDCNNQNNQNAPDENAMQIRSRPVDTIDTINTINTVVKVKARRDALGRVGAPCGGFLFPAEYRLPLVLYTISEIEVD